MGQTDSSRNYHLESLRLYDQSLEKPCLFPDIGIDESLLKYSGLDSNAVLQVFSDEMLKTVPGYVSSLGSAFGALKNVPNAVGLGALAISMFIEIAIKSRTQTSDHTSGLLRRVFGEEKASSVRDTMSEYLTRHRRYKNKNNEQRLLEEIRRLEQQLSNNLTALRNSLLLDGHMSSRGFKIWVNGAAFLVQMLIHEARLNVQTGKPPSDLNAIEAAIDLYLQDLDHLLEKYKTYKINSDIIWYRPGFAKRRAYFPAKCVINNDENENCELWIENTHDCSGPEVDTIFMDIVYSNSEPIKASKRYFLNTKNNLNSLIHQHDSFTLPSAAG
ncbi:hypothetical protein R3I94_021750 [Phoxinus phoxinus]